MCNCSECDNFKYQGEAHNNWDEKFSYGECNLTGEYKTNLTPCTQKYKTHRWCHDESIQLDHSDFCERYNYNYDRCFSKKFWEELTAPEEIDKHFINAETYMDYPNIHQVYYISPPDKIGGFGNARYNIEFEDGTLLEDVGLWGNGFSPNKEIIDKLKKGKLKW